MQEIVVDVVQRLPQATISRAWGWLARRQKPRLFVSAFKHSFVAATGIDMSESADAIGTYRSLEELFVRKLRNGARRIDSDPQAFISPVDGTLGAFGTITDGKALQVKGRWYDIGELLGDDAIAKDFADGTFITIYLAPHNYHRIHSPLAGAIRQATLLPGGLMPVFEASVRRVESLFARNERLISYIDNTSIGRIALVKVGATLVGRISVAYDDQLYSNVKGQLRRQLSYDPPYQVTKGGEVGAFELGSTVVLLTEKNKLKLTGLREGQPVKMGERLGTVQKTA